MLRLFNELNLAFSLNSIKTSSSWLRPFGCNGACAGNLVEKSWIECGGSIAALWSYQGKFSSLGQL